MKHIFKISSLLTIIVSALAAIAISSCSKSQADVDNAIQTIDNYANSIRQTTSAEELLELDQAFAKDMQRYADSDAKLTDADRQALIEATGKVSTAALEKITEFNGGASPISDEQFQQRARAMNEMINSSTTLGQVVTGGL